MASISANLNYNQILLYYTYSITDSCIQEEPKQNKGDNNEHIMLLIQLTIIIMLKLSSKDFGGSIWKYTLIKEN